MTDTLTDISKLINKLGELGKQSKYYYDEYKKAGEQIAELKERLMQALQASGMRSGKTEYFNAAIASKPSIQVIHEQSVLEWLKDSPDIETDQYIGLKKIEFKSLALSMLKNTGEVVPGCELATIESISVRANKK